MDVHLLPSIARTNLLLAGDGYDKECNGICQVRDTSVAWTDDTSVDVCTGGLSQPEMQQQESADSEEKREREGQPSVISSRRTSWLTRKKTRA